MELFNLANWKVGRLSVTNKRVYVLPVRSYNNYFAE
jgi:hypothetical protein